MALLFQRALDFHLLCLQSRAASIVDRRNRRRIPCGWLQHFHRVLLANAQDHRKNAQRQEDRQPHRGVVRAGAVRARASEGARPFLELSSHLDTPAVLSVLFQAYVTTVFGYWVWNTLIRRYSAAQVAPLSLLVPVSGLATSWLVFDEHLAPAVWSAIGLVLAGVAVFVLGARGVSRAGSRKSVRERIGTPAGVPCTRAT